MATERRNQLLLAALVLVLGFVGYRAWVQTSAGPGTTSNGRRPAPATSAGRAQQSAASGVEAPDVHLDQLERDRPKPDAQARNLFRFHARAAAPPPPAAGVRPPAAVPVAPPPTAPAGPPPPPPIGLKFIGVIDRGAGQPKIAVLSDGIGPPIHGIEGGTVAGKYRILRIGAESIEMAYLDGRGRQTIRLSGS